MPATSHGMYSGEWRAVRTRRPTELPPGAPVPPMSTPSRLSRSGSFVKRTSPIARGARGLGRWRTVSRRSGAAGAGRDHARRRPAADCRDRATSWPEPSGGGTQGRAVGPGPRFRCGDDPREPGGRRPQAWPGPSSGAGPCGRRAAGPLERLRGVRDLGQAVRFGILTGARRGEVFGAT
jgi:hypothetical protein